MLVYWFLTLIVIPIILIVIIVIVIVIVAMYVDDVIFSNDTFVIDDCHYHYYNPGPLDSESMR